MREGKRGEAAAGVVLFLLLALLLPTLCTAYTLLPEQIHSLPASIQLNYSAPVNITNGSLSSVSTGALVQQYKSSQFVDDGSHTAFIIGINDIIPDEEGYYLVVSKTDGQPPYKSLSDDAIWFDYVPSDAGLNIHLVDPKPLVASNGTLETGFANSSPYDLTFSTTKPAWCKYSTTGLTNPSFMKDFEVTGTPSNPVTTHVITGRSESIINPLIVLCNSTADGVITRAFTVGFLRTPPDFSLALNPLMIVDPLGMNTNMSAISKNVQQMYCTAVGDGETHSFAPSGLGAGDAGAYTYTPWTIITFAEQPATPENKTFLVTCTNFAGLSSHQTKDVLINLNFNPAISMVSPGPYTAQHSPIFAVEVVKRGIPVQSQCAFSPDNMSQKLSSTDDTIYNTTFSDLADGDYTYNVVCTIANGQEVSGDLSFIVDTAAPPTTGRTLSVPQYVCAGEPLTAALTLAEDTQEDPNFAGYLYNITYSTGNVVLLTGSVAVPSNANITADFATEENRTYLWTVWPVDAAGNIAQPPLTSSTEVVAANDTRCDHTPPSASLETNETLLGTLVTVLCDDDRGCADQFKYDQLAANATPDECTYANVQSLNQTLLFTENGTLCYAVFDKNDNNATGFAPITVDTAIIASDAHCYNNVTDTALGETGVDCGGDCPPCQDGGNCTRGGDCRSGFCNTNLTCEVTSCTNNLKDGYETDVDCGGPTCPKCAAGLRCTAAGDCESDNCDAGTGLCANATMTTNMTGCTYDTDCHDTGMRCDSTGQCVPAERKNCTSQDMCGQDQICGPDGTCQQKPQQITCSLDTDCTEPGTKCDTTAGICVKKGPSLLSLIFFFLGLVVMAGSGYWLYSIHQERSQEQQRDRAAADRPAYAPRAEELTPEQRLALLRQRQAQLEALRQRQQQAAQQRATAKESERAGALQSLEEKKPMTAAADKSPQTGQEDASADEFVDITEIGKRIPVEKSATEQREQPKKRKKTDDAFSDLDKVIGGK